MPFAAIVPAVRCTAARSTETDRSSAADPKERESVERPQQNGCRVVQQTGLCTTQCRSPKKSCGGSVWRGLPEVSTRDRKASNVVMMGYVRRGEVTTSSASPGGVTGGIKKSPRPTSNSARFQLLRAQPISQFSRVSSTHQIAIPSP